MARRGASAALALVFFFATVLVGECSNNLSRVRSYSGILTRYVSLFTLLKTVLRRHAPCLHVVLTAAPLPQYHTPFCYQQGGTGLTLPPHKRG